MKTDSAGKCSVGYKVTAESQLSLLLVQLVCVCGGGGLPGGFPGVWTGNGSLWYESPRL